MKNKIIIKGNKYGITIVMDKELPFTELLDQLKLRLENAEKFFDDSKQIAVAFEGRDLSNDELDSILDVIRENSHLNIQYVIDDKGDNEELFHKIYDYNADNATAAVPQNPVELTVNDESANQAPEYPDYNNQDSSNIDDDSPTIPSSGMFYKGTLRSGQTLEADDSIVIIGDVNPGASVIAGGNIVIIGSLTGSVQAGAKGNRNSFVMALSMNPIQIQIADIIARSADRRERRERKNSKKEAMIATVMDNHIYMENISKTAINDIII